MSANRDWLLSNVPHRIRERAAELQSDLRRWCADVREDPALLWRTTVVRLLLWLALGVCAIIGVRFLATALLPVTDGSELKQATPMATLYVACIRPDCHASYIVERPMDFDTWPLTCRDCGHPTVYRARLCPACRQWYATAPGAPKQCPFCAVSEPEEPEAPKPIPANPDDDEDPW